MPDTVKSSALTYENNIRENKAAQHIIYDINYSYKRQLLVHLGFDVPLSGLNRLQGQNGRW